MNRGEARTRCRVYLNERSAAQWSDTELDDLLLEAEREVYEEIVAKAPQLFTKVARFTWSGDTFSIDLSAQLDSTAAALGDYWHVRALFTLEKNAAPGRTNQPIPFYPAQNMVDLWIDTHAANQVISSRNALGEQWLEDGGTMYIHPVPQNDRYLWIHLLPRLNVTSTDAMVLLSIDSGTSSPIVEMHELIPILAAVKALASVRDAPQSLGLIYKRRLDAALKMLGPTSNRMEPRRVGR